jgi:hypothetical protein
VKALAYRMRYESSWAEPTKSVPAKRRAPARHTPAAGCEPTAYTNTRLTRRAFRAKLGPHVDVKMLVPRELQDRHGFPFGPRNVTGRL